MATHTKEFLAGLSPKTALQMLQQGNQRFTNNEKKDHNLLQQVAETAGGQNPFAIVLSCMDSRTSVEHIFDQGLGDVFSIRIAGNIVNDDIIGSMEYACKVVGTKLIMVLGHTGCGAVKGACDGVELGNLTHLLQKIKPAIAEAENNEQIPKDASAADKVAYANVIHGMNEVLNRSTIIKELFDQGKIGIVGGMYNLENGKVQLVKELFS